MKWQLRRCLHCGHEEQFPALQPMEGLCSQCGTSRLDFDEESTRRAPGRTLHVPVCLCGCNAVLVGMVRRDTLYASRACSTRAWKARVRYDEARQAQRSASRLPARATS